MQFKLKVEFGKVAFLTPAGKDMVKSVMTEENARRIIKEGSPIKDDSYPGYPIKAKEYYFEGIIIEDKKQPKVVKTDEN